MSTQHELVRSIPSKHCLPWTEEDIAKLKEVFQKVGRNKAAKILGRSVKAVATKACELRLVRTHKRRDIFDEPTDFTDGPAFRRECEASKLRYLRAVVKANDGCCWSGGMAPNAMGSHR